MMLGWNFDTNNNTTKAEFTKFPVGVTHIRVIDNEPLVRWTHWMPQFKRSINCPGKGCPICEIRKQQKANKEPYSHGMSRRFAINILNKETGRVEIMEQGITFFEDLKLLMLDLADEKKRLIDVDIKVRRRGTGKDDTSYRLDVGEETPLTDNEKRIIEEGRIDLQEYFKPHTNEQILRLLNGESWEEVMNGNNNDVEEEQEIEIK